MDECLLSRRAPRTRTRAPPGRTVCFDISCLQAEEFPWPMRRHRPSLRCAPSRCAPCRTSQGCADDKACARGAGTIKFTAVRVMSSTIVLEQKKSPAPSAPPPAGTPMRRQQAIGDGDLDRLARNTRGRRRQRFLMPCPLPGAKEKASIPMVPRTPQHNFVNAVSVVVCESWRQLNNQGRY